MHIHHRPSSCMLQGRQFMRPLAIEALIVRIQFHRRPTGGKQGLLNASQIGTRHQDVDVRRESSHSGRQPAQDVRSAFEHDDLRVNRAKGHLDAPDFPAHGTRMLLRDRARGECIRLREAARA